MLYNLNLTVLYINYVSTKLGEKKNKKLKKKKNQIEE